MTRTSQPSEAIAMLDWYADGFPGTGTAADIPPTLGTLGKVSSKLASSSSAGANGSASKSMPLMPPSLAFRFTSSVSPPPLAPRKKGVAPAFLRSDTDKKGPFSTSTGLQSSASVGMPIPPLATHATNVLASNLGRNTSRKFLKLPDVLMCVSAMKTIPASKPVPTDLQTSSMASCQDIAVEQAAVIGSETSITSGVPSEEAGLSSGKPFRAIKRITLRQLLELLFVLFLPPCRLTAFHTPQDQAHTSATPPNRWAQAEGDLMVAMAAASSLCGL
mmetsp:Transcript_68857/g.128525  ORF Transcript_68857/g.128525 Transcript_68857/m.128525 type:complete len:275 (+) Transcript_68857:794-1618(+)